MPRQARRSRRSDRRSAQRVPCRRSPLASSGLDPGKLEGSDLDSGGEIGRGGDQAGSILFGRLVELGERRHQRSRAGPGIRGRTAADIAALTAGDRDDVAIRIGDPDILDRKRAVELRHCGRVRPGLLAVDPGDGGHVHVLGGCPALRHGPAGPGSAFRLDRTRPDDEVSDPTALDIARRDVARPGHLRDGTDPLSGRQFGNGDFAGRQATQAQSKGFGGIRIEQGVQLGLRGRKPREGDLPGLVGVRTEGEGHVFEPHRAGLGEGGAPQGHPDGADPDAQAVLLERDIPKDGRLQAQKRGADERRRNQKGRAAAIEGHARFSPEPAGPVLRCAISHGGIATRDQSRGPSVPSVSLSPVIVPLVARMRERQVRGKPGTTSRKGRTRRATERSRAPPLAALRSKTTFRSRRRRSRGGFRS